MPKTAKAGKAPRGRRSRTQSITPADMTIVRENVAVRRPRPKRATTPRAPARSHVSVNGPHDKPRNEFKKIVAKVSAVPNPAAKALMVPHDTHPFRYSTPYTSVPTVVAQPYIIEDQDFTEAFTSEQDLTSVISAGNSLTMISRNPLAARIKSYRNDGRQQYFVAVPSSYSMADPAWHNFNENIITIPANSPRNIILQPAFMKQYDGTVPSLTTLGASVHGGRLYASDFLDTKCLYIDAAPYTAAGLGVERRGMVQASLFTTAPVGFAGMSLGVQKLVGDRFIHTASAKFSSAYSAFFPAVAGRTFTANSSAFVYVYEPGYYRFVLDTTLTGGDVPAAAFNMELAISQNPTTGFSIEPMPGLLDHVTTVANIRVNAASVMLTPHCSALSKGGIVSGRQLEEEMLWHSQITLTAETLAGYQGATQMDLGKGIYGFHKPSSEGCFSLITPFYDNQRVPGTDATSLDSQNLNMASTHNPVYPPGGWLILAAEAPLGEFASASGVASQYPGGRTHITYCWGIEYTTRDVWLKPEYPRLSPDAFADALAIVRRAPQFHENPMHLADIVAFLKRAARTTWRYAPSLLNAIAMINPAMRPFAATVSAAKAAFDP